MSSNEPCNCDQALDANETIQELLQKITAMGERENEIIHNIRLCFTNPECTDGHFYIPIERYNKLVKVINNEIL